PHATGNGAPTAGWLWALHSEHRLPLPRLVLLALLELTGLDFRAGMVVNALALASLSAGLIVAAGPLRGRAGVAAAFFALMLLRWGHAENLLWSWQVGFILPTCLAGTVLLVIVRQGTRLTAAGAAAAGVCLVLLPLCGANGVALVPALALWLGGAGVV